MNSSVVSTLSNRPSTAPHSVLEVFELGFENISTRSPPCQSSAKPKDNTTFGHGVARDRFEPKKRTQRRRTKMDVVQFIDIA